MTRADQIHSYLFVDDCRILEQVSLGEANNEKDQSKPLLSLTSLSSLHQGLYLCLGDAKFSAVRIATLDALTVFWARPEG